MTVLTSPQPVRDSLPSLLDDLLREQQELTASQRYSQFHETATQPLLHTHYRELIPATPPAPGQQYAFEVNLDDCSGCKACVTACHKLNGLEEDETWRSVGLLHGGYASHSMQQHVTTACHHCVEPGCLAGCPVMAYDKDPLTGIVRHLDDQCIGCQYCLLMCPYEVPQYSVSKGIVRKCDMCSSRLSAGEAPACVQACPHEAIRITTVDTTATLATCQAEPLLPHAPDSRITKPTTRYLSARPFPHDTVPADRITPRPQHAHWPLLIMLVLTQLAVGVISLATLLHMLPLPTSAASSVVDVLLVVGVGIGMLGMTAAVFHLGRPFYAFRALLGLRTSWMSREILAFNVFAGFATGSFILACLRLLSVNVPSYLITSTTVASSLTGLGAIYCSVMIYVATRKPLWNFARTSALFYLSALLLGSATVVVLSAAYLPNGEAYSNTALGPVPLAGVGLIIIATCTKLLIEASLLLHLPNSNQYALRHSAMLTAHRFRSVCLARYACGVLGGIALPLATLGAYSAGSGTTALVLAALSWGLLLVGELGERYLFFTTVAADKMPGAV